MDDAQKRAPPGFLEQRALDAQRSVIFFGAALAAALSALVRAAYAQQPLWHYPWEIGSAVVCLFVGVAVRQPSERTRTVATTLLALFFLCTTPLAVITEGNRTDLMVLLSLPLALSVIFVERFVVVGMVSACGLCVNGLTLLALEWPADEVLHACAGMAALYGAGMASSREFARFRRKELADAERLRKATAAYIESERLAQLGLLAAGVGHEINNPLAYLTMNLRVLEEGDGAPSQQRQAMWEDVRYGAAQIAFIVKDLKALTRQLGDEAGVVDIASLLRRVGRFATLRSGPKFELELHIEEDLRAARADEGRLTQVITNLVANATDALENTTHRAPVISIAARSEGDHIVVDVDDNGTGISEAAAQRLFEPFFTTKPIGRGTGLGLALSREYVETFGGTLEFQPRPGAGARFRLTLRAA